MKLVLKDDKGRDFIVWDKVEKKLRTTNWNDEVVEAVESVTEITSLCDSLRHFNSLSTKTLQ